MLMKKKTKSVFNDIISIGAVDARESTIFLFFLNPIVSAVWDTLSMQCVAQQKLLNDQLEVIRKYPG